MSNKEITAWGIHGGKTGDADKLFLKEKYIGIGWIIVKDLRNIKPPTREGFKEEIAKCYPDSNSRSVGNNAGQLFRFIYEIKTGDIVIYPSKKDRKIHIGEVTGAYEYNNKLEPGYPHIRPVKWLCSYPRTHFTQGALYEIGSAMSLFQVKTYSDEFLAAIKGEKPTVVSKNDDTINLVAEEIEQTTYDFILKQLSQELKGHPLTHLVAHLLEAMGYRTRISKEGPDGGIDIIAHKDELGFEPPVIKVQVKSTDGSVGDPIVSSLYGKVDQGEYGLLVTLGTFTSQAKNFAKNKSNLRLIDGSELVELILNHYEQLDSRYKGLIPLKRVYIPEVIEDSE